MGERLASELVWHTAKGCKKAVEVAERDPDDPSTTCRVVTHRMPSAHFYQSLAGRPRPREHVTMARAKTSTCNAVTMLAPIPTRADGSPMPPPEGKDAWRLPCCRSHFQAWLEVAPVDAVRLGVMPVRAWSAQWCSWPCMYLLFSTPFGDSTVRVEVELDQLEILVDLLAVRGLVNDEIAALLRRNAWRVFGVNAGEGLPRRGGPYCAGLSLPPNSDALRYSSLVTRIHRGGADARAAVGEIVTERFALSHNGFDRAFTEARQRDLDCVLACITAIAHECDLAPVKELLDLTIHVRGPEWQTLARQVQQLERDRADESEGASRTLDVARVASPELP